MPPREAKTGLLTPPRAPAALLLSFQTLPGRPKPRRKALKTLATGSGGVFGVLGACGPFIVSGAAALPWPRATERKAPQRQHAPWSPLKSRQWAVAPYFPVFHHFRICKGYGNKTLNKCEPAI